jgi:serine phosphatase RsbU (regulator of sigma subunit)
MLAGWFLAVEINERIAATAARTQAQAERDQANLLTKVLELALRPEPPRAVPNLVAGSVYQPASDTAKVGGDWHDVVVLPKDRILLTVGDVVGHGVDAVEDMTQLRFATRTLAYGQHSPASILTELAEITATATRGQFATAVVAIYDPRGENLTYARAGHPPPALRRAADGDVAWLEEAAGEPLRPDVCSPYTEAVVGFARGDLLILYSDGLIERRGTTIDAGLDRLAATLATWSVPGNLEGFCHRLIEDCGGGILHTDDVCVLATTRLT